jgi:hypothetical protein
MWRLITAMMLCATLAAGQVISSTGAQDVDITIAAPDTISVWHKPSAGTWGHYASNSVTGEMLDGVVASWGAVVPWTYSGGVLTFGESDGLFDDGRGYSTALTSNQVARLTLDTCEMYDPTLCTNAALHSAQTTWETGYGNTNLVGAWRGDRAGIPNTGEIGPCRDVVGNYTGIASGTPSHTVVDGVGGWDFDGGSECFIMPYEQANDLFTGLSNLTVSVWLNQDSWVKNSGAIGTDATQVRGFRLRTGYNDSPYQGMVAYVGNASAQPSAWYTGAWTDNNEWTHVLFRWDNSRLELWVDGEPVSTNLSANCGVLAFSGDNPVIGARDGTASANGFNGTVSNLQIWDAYLSEDSISILTSSPHVAPGQVSEAGLLSYYPMYRNCATIPDISGNGNDGTAYNSPTIEAAR